MSHGVHAISQMYRVANSAPAFVCIARKAFETSSLDSNSRILKFIWYSCLMTSLYMHACTIVTIRYQYQ